MQRFSYQSYVNSLFIGFLLFTTPSTHAWFGQDDKVFWHFRDEYVRLESSDTTNEHPAQLSPAEVRASLASISVQMPDSAISLFSHKELETLSEPVSKALAAAKPNEDVTIAIIGMHPGVISQENRVTTARLFVQQHKLNVIVGDVHKEIDYEEDRRLNPFTAGTRAQSKTPSRPLVAQTGQSAVNQRKDWVAIDVATAVATAPKITQNNANLSSDVAKTQAQAVKAQADAEKAQTESARLAQSVEQLKQEVHALKQQPAVVTTNATKETVSKANVADKSLEQKLHALKELRAKDLISEEVYQKKQQQLLDAL